METAGGGGSDVFRHAEGEPDPAAGAEAIDAVAERTGRTRSATVETLAPIGLALIG